MKMEMDVLDSTGHTKTTWDPDVPAEVEAARKQFDELRKKGHKAFRVKRSGEPGEPMATFDSGEGAMILMIPPIVGG